jgi:hypothetical protein
MTQLSGDLLPTPKAPSSLEEQILQHFAQELGGNEEVSTPTRDAFNALIAAGELSARDRIMGSVTQAIEADGEQNAI